MYIFYFRIGSGKTTIVMEILKHRDKFFSEKPVGVVYAYGAWQELYETDMCKKFHFIHGIPNKDEIQSFIDKFEGGFFILVIDDLMNDAVDSQLISDIFTKGAHHDNYSAFLITQNLYVNGRKSRNIGLNSQYFLLCRTSRDLRQISNFGSTVFGPNKGAPFLQAYTDAVDKPFSLKIPPFLFVNCHPRVSREYRLMSNILAPNGVKIVYKLD